MTAVIALDAGTTGVRTIAFDENSREISTHHREFTQYFPRPGWVEHDANEIWEAMAATLAATIVDLDEGGHAVAAIGITDQRETIVAWDRRTGEPLHRAIVWQDRRTARRCEQLEADGNLPLVRDKTGLVLDPYFSASKIEWLLNEGELPAGPDVAFGTIDSWLIWQLTAGEVHATDPSNAARTMLFDIGEMAWSEELCDLFGVPIASLPEVRPSSGRVATTAPGLPIPAGIPVSGIAGDQQAALFGQGCTQPGMAKNTYGTGSFVLMNVGERCPPPVEGVLTTVAWTLGSDGVSSTTYALEGAIFATGAAVQWLRDGLGIISEAEELEPLAASVDDAEGVVLVPAFTGLGSPYWDPYARGTLLGITRGTGRAQIARAVVDSMTLQTRAAVEAMAGAAGQDLRELRADGGAAVMDLLLQLQADQLGVSVARAAVTESTALGAAHLAGLAEGVWASVDELADSWQSEAIFEPSGDRTAVDAAYSTWTRAVERASSWDT